jgi:hypothetical protein
MQFFVKIVLELSSKVINLAKGYEVRISRFLFLVPISFVLLLPFLFASRFHAQDEPIIHEVGQKPDALSSAAACANVPYGTPETVAQSPVSDDIAHFVIPPNPQGAELVDLGLFIEGITNIDPVSNSFTIEGFLDLIWCDPRESFNAEELGWHEKFFLEDDALEELNEIWQPDITFPNESSPRETENLELIVFEDGTIEYAERFSVTLEAKFDLLHFPFDTQVLEIEIESLAWSERYLLFHEEENTIGFRSDFELAEWHTADVETHLESVREIRDRQPFSEFVMLITVERLPGFYIWRLILPMIIIVALSWSVFWMKDDDLSNRLMVSFTGILTVVAYQFTISDSLPRIPYITFMDAVITFSFFMMALTIIENIVVYILDKGEKKTWANHFEFACRFVFPSLYTTALIFIAFYFGIF